MIAKHISFGTGAFTKSYCLNDFIPFSKHVATSNLLRAHKDCLFLQDWNCC